MIGTFLQRPVVVATVGATVVMGLGGALTKLGPWYEQLRKPSWQPPGWVFPTVWTSIAALTVWSVSHGWPLLSAAGLSGTAIALFAVNGVLNVAWSGLFFSLQRPDWSLIEVVPLWASVLSLVVLMASVSPFSALLLLPYLLWVGIAAVLNRAIVRLNQPFGAEARPAV
ncbi:tryptophan-rich sensory protein [Acetobacteraceae bacterium KSS8]|uniref:Tryptophan-rich sensory protein n=1 Tax=Endosaccharibacter trunci TaxID=2812733 RepID=A0ABT1W3N8_9PROT|nr:tryptophan-rich sensory protein [Acetobacteraceae bacterium KSS8]